MADFANITDFVDVLKKYQGARNFFETQELTFQDPSIKHVISILIEEMKKRNLTSEQNQTNSISKRRACSGLRELGLIQYYENINEIYHTLTIL